MTLPSKYSRLQRALTVLLVAVLIPPILVITIPILLRKITIFNPEIRFATGFAGFGPSTSPFLISAQSKSGAPLASLTVKVVVNGRSYTLLSKVYSGPQEVHEEIPFSVIHSKIADGQALLEITAVDGGWIEGSTIAQKEILVDALPPSLESISSHAAPEEASRVLFYKVKDAHLIRSGIRRDGEFFRGYPAWTIDREFSTFPNLYIVVYAHGPGDYGEDILFAEDSVGNATKIALPKLQTPPPATGAQVTLSEAFMTTRVRSLSDESLPILQKQGSITTDAYKRAFYPKDPGEEVVQKFLLLNRALRKINDEELARKSQAQKLGLKVSNSFLLPTGEQVIGFNAPLHYMYKGVSIAEGRSFGLLFRPQGRSERVVSANDGIVSFVGSLCVYGRCIVIDHGLGIRTLYGHLGNFSVSEGAPVQRGQLIGYAGDSGLTSDLSLYFQLNVGDVPVDPNAWGTPERFYHRYTTAFEDARRKLGLPVAAPLYNEVS